MQYRRRRLQCYRERNSSFKRKRHHRILGRSQSQLCPDGLHIPVIHVQRISFHFFEGGLHRLQGRRRVIIHKRHLHSQILIHPLTFLQPDSRYRSGGEGGIFGVSGYRFFRDFTLRPRIRRQIALRCLEQCSRRWRR